MLHTRSPNYWLASGSNGTERASATILGARCPGSLSVYCTSTRDVSNTTPSSALLRTQQAQSHYASLFAELHFLTGHRLPGEFPVSSHTISADPAGPGCRNCLFVFRMDIEILILHPLGKSFFCFLSKLIPRPAYSPDGLLFCCLVFRWQDITWQAAHPTKCSAEYCTHLWCSGHNY